MGHGKGSDGHREWRQACDVFEFSVGEKKTMSQYRIVLTRLAVVGVLVAASFGGGFHLGVSNFDRGARVDPTLEYVKQQAVIFLDAVKDQDGTTAYALLSKDFRDRLTDQERAGRTWQWPQNNGRPTRWRWASWYETPPVFSKSNEQVIFTVVVTFPTGDEGKQVEMPARLVMVKDRESAAWKVDLFTNPGFLPAVAPVPRDVPVDPAPRGNRA